MERYREIAHRFNVELQTKTRFEWPLKIRVPTLTENGIEYAIWLHDVPMPVLYERRDLDQISAVAIGPIIKTDPSIVNYRSSNNQLRGMIKRVAHAFTYTRDRDPTQDKMNSAVKQSFKQFVQSWLKRYDPLPYIEMTHENLDELWLNGAKHYTLKQKETFHALLENFLQSGPKDFNHLRGYNHGDIYACNSFIKKEFYAETKEPRIINSRSDLFKALVAPYIKEIEHNVIYNEHFIKGKHPTVRAQRMQEIADKYRFIAESDYSSFEGSFSPDICSVCEWALFRHMLQKNPLAKLILKPIYLSKSKNTCIFSTNHDYVTFEGSRMSGDMWTSLGNGFTNMMLFLYCAEKSRKYPWEHYDFIVEGDDGFFGYNYDIDFTPVTRLGFQLKIKKGTDINDLSFCGTCLGPDAKPYPDFWRTLEKFGWTFEDHILNHYSNSINKAEDELLYSKALSLLAESEGVPVLQPLALKILQLIRCKKLVKRYITYYEEEILQLSEYTPNPTEITRADREFMATRFNLTIDKQLEVERIISNATSVRLVLPVSRPHGM